MTQEPREPVRYPESNNPPSAADAWPWPSASESSGGHGTDGGALLVDTHQPEQPASPTDPGHRSRRYSLPVMVVVAVFALLVGLLGGLLLAPVFGIAYDQDASPQPEDPQSVPSTLPTGGDESGGTSSGSGVDIASIAAQALPRTVAIETIAEDGTGGSGSGLVLRADGYILTNAHVVTLNDAGEVALTVIFSDGSEEEAELVGVTQDYDLAVLRVDRTDLEPLVLADSDQLAVGQPVVAVGAPLGLEGTVTSGIVSALNRPVQAGDAQVVSFINAIQTDAAINPGNSGGPLLNADGEVVGINSAIAQASGQATGNIGLGFAIPSNQARRTAEQLIEFGYATYPVVGVLLNSGYTGEGVQVAEEAYEDTPPLTPGGPAELAGIEPGDLIVALDGEPMTSPDELIVAIRAHAPGDEIVLTIRDGDVERDVAVTLGEERSE